MTGPVARRAPDDGLQPERTWLSWSRTSFGVLGNGALLLWRETSRFEGPLRLAPAMLAVAVALLTAAVGYRRQRVLRRRPLPARVAATAEVRVVGAAVLALTIVTAVAILA